MSTGRQEVRYQRLREAESEEQEEVTVHLYSDSARPVVQARCRDAIVRVCASLILLAVAIGFVLYEVEYGGVERPPTPQSLDGHLDPPWNINELESSLAPPNHHGTHHHFEDLEVKEDHEDGDHEDGGHEDGGHQHGDHVDGDHQHGDHEHHHSAGTYHHAVAITSSESCSGEARDVLRSGGSVVDAAVTAALCLSVVHSHSTSLGGIFSSIYFNVSSQNASVLNAIPGEASPTTYGVPAVLQGLWSLHQRYGRKPWSELFTPAIRLAREGFLVDSSLHAALEENQVKVMSSEGLRELFFDQNILKSVGARVTNMQLGNILEAAQTMTDASLPGELVEGLLRDIEVTHREKFFKVLVNVQPENEDPLGLHLDGLTLYSSSAPTAGRILINSVQEVYQKHGNKTSDTMADLIGASKTMYTMAGVWPPDTADNRTGGILNTWHSAPVGSNILVADANGDVLVISLTLNNTFGSGFVSPSTGILLSDFVQGTSSVEPTSLVFWACPSVLLYGEDGDIMGLAARGDSSLPFSLAHLLLSHVLLEMDLTESISGTSADLTPADPDPWLRYFGLQGGAPQTVMAVEVRAEHVHAATAQGCSCHPTGL